MSVAATSRRPVTSSSTTRPTRRRAPDWSTTLWAVGGSVLVLLVVQGWSALHLTRSTTELHSILSESRLVAMEFERRIGYGGLIHNFKNYVLRPREERYRTLALRDAERALHLLDRLEESAEGLGVDVSLTNTRRMIEFYSERLAQVRELAVNNLSARAVDLRVRYDDQPALQEVNSATSLLERAIEGRVETLQRREAMITMSSTAITAILGATLVGFVGLRKQRYTSELDVLFDALVKSNDELQGANASLNRFAGIVSHDLKTPLRHMSILGEFIREDRDDHEAVDAHLDTLERQASKMALIVDSLLDFTETAFNEPRVGTVDLEQLFRSVKRDLEPELEKGNASIESEIELDGPIRADPELLSRVFCNLIGNSLKYARPGVPARIVVRAVTDGERTVITVTDNGIGIEKRFARKIFEPMQRLHGPHSGYEGVGIGLALVRSIVESHGGAIWLDTDFVDGTRIGFSLPGEPCSRQRPTT